MTDARNLLCLMYQCVSLSLFKKKFILLQKIQLLQIELYLIEAKKMVNMKYLLCFFYKIIKF